MKIATERKMIINLSIANYEAIHNLINLYLYPKPALLLGQDERYKFHEADVVLERTGNLYSYGRDAVTYRYNIDGNGFAICLLAVWRDELQATADVHVVALSPDGKEGHEALRAWLDALACARLPRDLFACELASA